MAVGLKNLGLLMRRTKNRRTTGMDPHLYMRVCPSVCRSVLPSVRRRKNSTNLAVRTVIKAISKVKKAIRNVKKKGNKKAMRKVKKMNQVE